MDAETATPTLAFNRWLPFWAVFQADARQTTRGWIYKAWLFLSIAAVLGYGLYSFGAKRESGQVMLAQNMITEILRWTLWGSVTLIIVLASGTICSEYGEVADSVLCRGISRYQYFFGKLLSRLFVILGTFLLFAGLCVAASFTLLHGDHLSWHGCLWALGTVAAVLALVVTYGVMFSAFANNTVLSIALVWATLYGAGFLLTMVGDKYPTPDRALRHLPNILRGYYDPLELSRLATGSLTLALILAVIGMFHFGRKDV